ncbi:MAG: hypothetical protein IJ424_06665 [Oscillospiraceae bacterium]|nr:hypothetical protein [Oscillospiraceae bacterium]
MINEKEYSYKTYCDVSMFDASGAMKPDAYQRICVGVVEKHLNVIELDVERLVKAFGVSWVLLSMTIDIKRPLVSGETITTQTWHTFKKGSAYRRDLILRDGNGEVVAVAATFSSLLDIKTRHICKDKAVHDVVSVPDGEPLLEASSRIKLMLDDFKVTETLPVRPNWIDAVGHVNNFRYGEMAYDALTIKKRSLLKQLKRMEVYFTGELTLGENVVIKSHECENDATVVGVRSSDEKTAFVAKLFF